LNIKVERRTLFYTAFYLKINNLKNHIYVPHHGKWEHIEVFPLFCRTLRQRNTIHFVRITFVIIVRNVCKCALVRICILCYFRSKTFTWVEIVEIRKFSPIEETEKLTRFAEICSDIWISRFVLYTISRVKVIWWKFFSTISKPHYRYLILLKKCRTFLIFLTML